MYKIHTRVAKRPGGPPKAGPVPKWELDAKQLRAVLAECRTLQIAAKKEIERAIQKSLLIAI